MIYGKKKIFVTYKHQKWTDEGKEALLGELDGYDDKILEFYVWNDDFAIIRRNGFTYDVKDSKKEAQEYIDRIYSAYDFYEIDDYCYVPVYDPDTVYESEEDAREDGHQNVIYVPRGYWYLAKNGRVIAKARNREELEAKMNADYGANYDYVC